MAVTVQSAATWINAGNQGFSAGGTNFTSIAFNPSNNPPYVAYADYGDSLGKATVMKLPN